MTTLLTRQPTRPAPARTPPVPVGRRPTEPGVRRGVRAEIQGLRAVAVGLVVVYHAVPSRLPGGYVGVDVFFVISGFLISRHLLQEAERTGRVRLRAFWAARVRRITPAALVVIVATTAAGAVVLPRGAAADAARTAWWACLSAANWLFAGQAVDYQAQSPDASPFEHFWSLGVEEQFYLLWPLLVLGAAALAARRRLPFRPVVAVAFGLVLVASLVFGVVDTATGSAAAYFITPTRMWELAAGGLLAALLGDRRPPAAWANRLQLAGTASIGAAAVLCSATTPMPGVAALVPVGGAVAVLAAGDAPLLREAWAMRPVRRLGDVSYSLYLWHWPMLVLARHVLGHPLGRLSAPAVILAALVLAVVSHRFVERPFRRMGAGRPIRTTAIGVGATVLAMLLVGVPVVRDAVLTAQDAAARQVVLRPGAGAPIGWPQLAGSATTWARPQHVVVPDPQTLAHDVSLEDCTSAPIAATSPVCVRGDAHAAVTVALVGDSHTRQWATDLERIAGEQHWRLVTILHNSCPFTLLPGRLEQEGRSHCTQAVRRSLPVLESLRPDVVITSDYRESYAPGDAGRVADAYTAMWSELRDRGIPVIAIGDTPAASSSPTTADCIEQRDPASCGVSAAQAERHADPLRAAAARVPGTAFLDPMPLFCRDGWCPGVIGNVAVWVDGNHASRTYLSTALPWVRDRIVPLVRRAVGSERG